MVCYAAQSDKGVRLKSEFAPIWKRPALVGWEERGKRQTGNGKGKHEVAGRVGTAWKEETLFKPCSKPVKGSEPWNVAVRLIVE